MEQTSSLTRKSREKLQMLFKFTVGVFLILQLYFVGLDSLSKYCSTVNKNQLLDAFKNCSKSKYMIDRRPSNNNKDQTSNPKFDDSYYRIVSMLDTILSSINSDASLSKNDTKFMFLDLLRVIEEITRHDQIKYCIADLCNLFKDCEFPVDVEYINFESDAMVASRLAATLTGLSYSEKFENRVYLSRLNLYSLLKLTLQDNENIYDAKIVFRQEANQPRLAFQAIKSIEDKSKRAIEVGNMKQIMENSKNFQWYYTWIVSDVKYRPNGVAKWLEKYELPKDEFDANQIRSIGQMSYPSSEFFNATRYVSHVTYDCLRATWSRIVSVPFFNANGDIRGVVSVSISLSNFDLKQCGKNEEDDDGDDGDDDDDKTKRSQELANLTRSVIAKHSSNLPLKLQAVSKDLRFVDPFYDTDKCDRQTTICKNIPGRGFVLDSYSCECKRGYYSGLAANQQQQHHHSTNKSKLYYKCFKCAIGCDTCVNDRPCQTEIPENFKRITLIINLTCMSICVILAILTWYHMKVLKTSSPKMLFMVLLGAFVSYCEVIPMYFEPNELTCTGAQIFQLEGFLLAYGALVLKTWRECKLFYVRSVKTIRITDQSLIKRLGIIMLIGTIYLAVWSFIKDRPTKVTVKDSIGLKYDTCTTTEWNFISMAIQLTILLYGAFLSIQVRRASIAFKETKLITWAIFNECVVSCFVLSINVLLKYTPVSVFVPYGVNYMRIHLAITVMLLLLFSYKVYTIIKARNKPMQANQSSNILSNLTVPGRDLDDKGNPSDETEKERELKIEIHRLYRQLEEMRSLSMRIANPHLLTKKSRFISYPTKKKEKSSKLKSQYLNSDNEISKALITNANNQQPGTAIQIDPITMDHPSFAVQNDNPSIIISPNDLKSIVSTK